MPDNNNNTIATQLADLIAGLDRHGTDTRTGLHELIDSGNQHVTGSEYAGITLAEKGKAITNVVATHRYPMVLDVIQNDYGEGPCVAAAWQHHVMHVEDLAVDRRWPRYQEYALANTPIRSILSFELFVDRDTTAALNFFGHHPYAFNEESIEVGGIFATHVALAWSMMRRHDQFRSALASRDIIGQAKGVIMERFNLDAVEAFDLLARLSQKSNTKLFDVARALIENEHPIKCRHN
ncbi:GAF and ANTAR domain-containing protein [Mycobacterium sp. 663a-19]|uniref:GAF and ANTAR domain-containing protein n=1 Tax=Mycobacterium sp. 663a-19 TaxID=2986148 RepID=UPI002D1F284F|nr:GAF and ANTAR domain-containing protein [Mycobacterium sp. 663a-19]MEB3982156.1 GAF and ANTAR domain-containing protein [Mycobacterium sp. 663a-19]